MNRLVIRLYDLFRRHRRAAWSLFAVLTVLLGWSVSRLDYQEDISAFLPLDKRNQAALNVYRDISGSNNVVAIVSLTDSAPTAGAEDARDRLADAAAAFAAEVTEADTSGLLRSVTARIDMDRMMELADSVCRLAPYLLTEVDYARIDSLLSDGAYADSCMAGARRALLFPTSGMMTDNLARDPLNLFAPLLERLRDADTQAAFDIYDGYILTPDGRRAVVLLESAFGGQESEHNALLARMLEAAAARTAGACPGIDISLTGGPVIAAGNAERIKLDSILAGAIAGVLILGLLIYVFRRARSIVLILLSVAWGWLFAMGMIALWYDSVSIIVIGIASVILGIAINYPLHLIDHLKEGGDRRRSLREIVSPLVIGNVTTVGAFLCLVPLNAPALHDLGLFSSLLLAGTILFVLAVLPHLLGGRRRRLPAPEPRLITRLGNVQPERHRWLVWTVLALTAVFAWFSQRTQFDSDMRNINYMSERQRSDMNYFQTLAGSRPGTERVYVASTADNWEGALRDQERAARTVDSLTRTGVARRSNEASAFFPTQAEQTRRLERWRRFTQRYDSLLTVGLARSAARHGFAPDAFADFNDIISADYAPLSYDAFVPLVRTVFKGNVGESADGTKTLVQTLDVPTARVAELRRAFEDDTEFHGLVFDVGSMNASIANTLSDDFNYIGLACGCIVFVFLWLSMGCIELAVVAFMPMAFSWIWILGIMGLLGIQFNIVNVILATFIFGQGDDYTIFITEGLSYEFAYRRRLLASYKSSIVVSALIMFIGIGTLVFARHPAMRSLGEVTVVGMLSVVLMAYLLPPLMFRWLVSSHGRLRRRPLTLRGLLGFGRRGTVADVELRYRYKGADIMRAARRRLKAIAPCLPQLSADSIDVSIPGIGKVEGSSAEGYTVHDLGNGELSLTVALLHPHTTVRCTLPDPDATDLLSAAALDFTDNIICSSRN